MRVGIKDAERLKDSPSSAPVCALGHLSLSPLSLRDIIPTPFGLRPFPPDRGNRPLDKGSRPQGEGLGKTKRDRFLTCPLKHRGETKFRTKFLCLLSFSKKVRGSGGEPEPLTCVCCKGEGEMGDIDFFWVRSYHNRKIRRNRVRIMNFL